MNAEPRRFALRVDWWLRPFLLLEGATRSRLYLSLQDATLITRMGFFYRETLHLEDIDSASMRRLRFWEFTWRNVFGHSQLANSSKGIVEIEFRRGRRLRMGFFRSLRGSLLVSLEEPDAFVAALNEALALRAGPD